MQAHPLSSPAARNPHLVANATKSNPPGSLPAQPLSLNAPAAGAPAAVSIAEGPGLAHDAGNLLGALGLYCDLLDAPGVLRPEHRHYARELRQLSQRSGALIQRLIRDGSRSAATPSARPASPADALRNLAPLLRSLTTPDALIFIEAAEGLPTLPFATETFERILVNLVRNAATALRPQRNVGRAAHIRVRLTGDNDHLVLVIEDNGPGMPPDVAARFLKPLPLPRGATSGLGHRIVKELLQDTRGRLTITVAPGRSSTLHIYWPITTPES